MSFLLCQIRNSKSKFAHYVASARTDFSVLHFNFVYVNNCRSKWIVLLLLDVCRWELVVFGAVFTQSNSKRQGLSTLCGTLPSLLDELLEHEQLVHTTVIPVDNTVCCMRHMSTFKGSTGSSGSSGAGVFTVADLSLHLGLPAPQTSLVFWALLVRPVLSFFPPFCFFHYNFENSCELKCETYNNESTHFDLQQVVYFY